jgi:hypothetical protein
LPFVAGPAGLQNVAAGVCCSRWTAWHPAAAVILVANLVAGISSPLVTSLTSPLSVTRSTCR